nr:copper resistance CopC/CopD family protein [Neorhizobium sp. S3-V5DH]
MTSLRTKFLPFSILRQIALAMLLWLGLAATASAHASLNATSPRDGSVMAVSPAVIRLTFSEPVSPTSLKLTLPDGRPVVLEAFIVKDKLVEVVPPADLSNGTHVLSWRVVSQDGHPIGGSVIFSIGHPGGASPRTGDIVDWSVRAGLWSGKVGLYIGLLFGIGGTLAASWFVQESRNALNFTVAALCLGLAGTLLSAGFQGLDTVGEPLQRILDPEVWKAGFATSFGRTVVFMFAALALSGLALASGPSRSARWISLSALFTAAVALSLSGHASAAEPQWIMRPAVFLHVAAISTWVGALLPLAAEFRRGGSDAAIALRRFSNFIPLSVAVLLIAGLILTYIQVLKIEALVTTSYGWVLLIKLGFLILLFALACINRWRLTNRAERGETAAITLLIRSIVAESLVVLLILGVAATWRFTPPPRSLILEVSEPAVVHIHSTKGMAEMEVTPGNAGPVTAAAIIMKEDFSPLDPQEVSFVFSNPTAGIEPIRRKADRQQGNTWSVTGLVLPVAGIWTVRIDVIISDFEIMKLEGEVEIKP